jgi:hypothetical protein
LSSLVAASDEQYKSIPDDEIALLARKFYALHIFYKERRRSPMCCFKCGDTTHFIFDYPKWKKLTPPISTTIITRMTPVIRARARRSTALGIRRR